MLLSPVTGDSGGDGQGRFWKKTSSESSGGTPASGCCWVELPGLESEIRLSVSRGILGPAGMASPPLPVCRTPGKTMASRLTRLSLSAACQSALSPSPVPAGLRGCRRPTEAARVEVAPPRCRSLLLLGRCLRVTAD